jgi:hypothetical protein
MAHDVLMETNASDVAAATACESTQLMLLMRVLSVVSLSHHDAFRASIVVQ